MNCNFVNIFKIMLQLILETNNKVIYMDFKGFHDIKIVRENHGGKISIFQVSKANSRLFPGFFQVSQIPDFFQTFSRFSRSLRTLLLNDLLSDPLNGSLNDSLNDPLNDLLSDSLN